MKYCGVIVTFEFHLSDEKMERLRLVIESLRGVLGVHAVESEPMSEFVIETQVKDNVKLKIAELLRKI